MEPNRRAGWLLTTSVLLATAFAGCSVNQTGSPGGSGGPRQAPSPETAAVPTPAVQSQFSVGSAAAEPTLAEPTLAEPTLAEPTLAEPTLAEPTMAEPTMAEPTMAPAISTPAAPPSSTTATSSKPSITPRPTLRSLAPPPPPPPGYQNLILFRKPTSSTAGTYWVINAFGTALKQIADGRYAHWNSDGSAIEVVAYDSNCVPSLASYSPNGGAPVVAPITFAAGDTGFSWTRDGSRISFYRHASSYNCHGISVAGNLTLYTVKSDGTGLTSLATGLAGIQLTAWVPDGSAIIMVHLPPMSQTGPIERISVADKNVRQILAAGMYGSVSVSADGKWLGYNKQTASQWRMHVTDNVGTGLATLRHHDYDLGQTAATDLYGVWGSDSKHFEVVRSQPDSQLGPATYVEYYRYDATKTTTAWAVYSGGLIPTAAAGNLDWNPDGSLIAASTISNFGQGKPLAWKILVGDTGGKSGIFLDGTETVDFLAWQPLP